MVTMKTRVFVLLVMVGALLHGNAFRANEPRANGKPEPKPIQLDPGTSQLVWSPDGRTFATVTSRDVPRPGGGPDDRDYFSTVKFWDAETGKEKLSLGELKNAGLFRIGFSPDGRYLAITFRKQIQEGDAIELWDVQKGELVRKIAMDYGRVAPFFTFAPDGKTIAVVYGGPPTKFEGGVRLWDTQTGEMKQYLTGHRSLVIRVAFSPNGKFLATGGDQHDKQSRLWDLKTGKESLVIDTEATVLALVFSPDGRTIATGLGDGRVVLWDVATGKAERTLEGAAASASGLHFSPDARLLAGYVEVEKDGKRTGEVRLWTARDGKLIQSWPDAAGFSLAYTPDGRSLRYVTRDKSLRSVAITATRDPD